MNDKLKHFIAGFLLSSLGIFWSPLIFLGFVAGIAKEIFDSVMGKRFDGWDLIATWSGAMLAIYVML